MRERLLDLSRSVKQFMEHMWHDSDPLLLAKTLIVWLILFFFVFLVDFFLVVSIRRRSPDCFCFFLICSLTLSNFSVLFLFFESFTPSSDCNCCSSLDFSASHSRIVFSRSFILNVQKFRDKALLWYKLAHVHFFLDHSHHELSCLLYTECDGANFHLELWNHLKRAMVL